jgi:predicted ATPase
MLGARATMAQRAEQIVGRAAEIGSFEEALDEVARRRPGALELVGEPGIGKTRLLTELGAAADRRGMLVLPKLSRRHRGRDPIGGRGS